MVHVIRAYEGEGHEDLDQKYVPAISPGSVSADIYFSSMTLNPYSLRRLKLVVILIIKSNDLVLLTLTY